jgi:hypothetical protein
VRASSTVPPMTPERAKGLGRWWRRVGLVLFVPVLPLFLIPSPVEDAGFLFVIGSLLCLLESRECFGWAKGYEVAERRGRAS